MEERDHKKLGPQLDLFYIDQEVGKGLPMFLPKGAIIKRELERFILEEEQKRGYQHVHTPDLARLTLYQKSGHYPHYRDSMYAPIEIDDEQFMLRPMTCPHHFQIYLHRPRSYRELPLRLAELAQLYRYEQSGELMGLQRLRTFCLADAHIICASEKQAMEEIVGALDLIEHVTSVFGLKFGEHYNYRLSLGDQANSEKYFKNPSAWDKGETLLRELMNQRGKAFTEAKGEAAFYGPKIDIQMKNVNGKEDTAFTVQYDFCMPEKCNLTYVDEHNQEQRAFVVHRSSIGAIERVMAFLIEYYAGAFPLWLAPVQVTVLPISDQHHQHAEQVLTELKKQNIRVELNLDNATLGKKIRQAKEQKVPYLVIIGDQEVASGQLTIEGRHEKLENVSVDAFIARLQTEISLRSL